MKKLVLLSILSLSSSVFAVPVQSVRDFLDSNHEVKDDELEMPFDIKSSNLNYSCAVTSENSNL